MDQFKSDSKSNSKIFSDKKCLNENDIMTNGSDFVYNIINGLQAIRKLVEKQRILISTFNNSKHIESKIINNFDSNKYENLKKINKIDEKRTSFETFSDLKTNKPQKNVKFYSKIMKLKVDEIKPFPSFNFKAIKPYLNDAKLSSQGSEVKHKCNSKSSKLSSNKSRSISNLPLDDLNQRINHAVETKKQRIKNESNAYNIRLCRLKNRFYDVNDIRNYIKEKKSRKIDNFEVKEKKCLKSYNIEEVREYMKKKWKELKAQKDLNFVHSVKPLKKEKDIYITQKLGLNSNKQSNKILHKTVDKPYKNPISEQSNSNVEAKRSQSSKKINKLDFKQSSDKKLQNIFKLLEFNPNENNCLLITESNKNEESFENLITKDESHQNANNLEDKSNSSSSDKLSQDSKGNDKKFDIFKLKFENMNLSEEQKNEIVKSLVKEAISEVSWDKLFQKVLKSWLPQNETQLKTPSSKILNKDSQLNGEHFLDENKLTSDNLTEFLHSLKQQNSSLFDTFEVKNKLNKSVFQNEEKQTETKEQANEKNNSNSSKFKLSSSSSNSVKSKESSSIKISDYENLTEPSFCLSITSSSLPVSEKLALIKKSSNYNYNSSSSLVKTDSILRITTDINEEDLIDDPDDTGNISSIESDIVSNHNYYETSKFQPTHEVVQLTTIDDNLIKLTLNEFSESILGSIEKNENWEWFEQNPQNYSENVNSYRLFLYDISKHLLESGFRKSNENPFNTETVHEMSKIIRKPVLPKTKEHLSCLLQDKIKKLLNYNQTQPKKEFNSLNILDFWRKNFKKNLIDQLIYREMREENESWNNFEEEELAIKNEISELIFNDILKELIQDIYENFKK